MRDEIEKLLEKNGIKLDDDEISKFFEDVKKLGLQDNAEKIKKNKITESLETKIIGKNIYIYDEVKSTNTIAKFFTKNNCENGTVIISEKQTHAKGRSGKDWDSPKGGIWLSIVLYPLIEINKVPLITIATGVAIAKTFEKIGIKNAKIKWPNDILINNKKIAGILIESKTKNNAINKMIIGVGIDANLDFEDLSEYAKEKATTFKKEGIDVDVNTPIKIFLEEFEKVCLLLREKKYEEILNESRKRSHTIGKTIEVREPFGRKYEGYVVGINKHGSLIIQKGDDSFEAVLFGECIKKED